MEHIAHHEPNSLLLGWLLLLLAMIIERLYRVRYLHRGEHSVRSAIDLVYSLWISLSCTPILRFQSSLRRRDLRPRRAVARTDL